MASAKTLAWIERLAWILIYAGLLALVVGLATRTSDTTAGWTLIVLGSAVAAAGSVLIWVRSRLHEGS